MVTNIQKSVLLSVRPKWAELILKGEKTLELRRTFPDFVHLPFRVYLYETAGKTDTPWMDEDGHMIFKGRGMVVGECMCDEIYDIHWAAMGGYYYLPPESGGDLRESKVDFQQMREYFGDRDGCGWHLTEVTAYETPRDIGEFRKPCVNALYCESCAMYNEYRKRCGNASLYFTRPPQSWAYAQRRDSAGGDAS